MHARVLSFATASAIAFAATATASDKNTGPTLNHADDTPSASTTKNRRATDATRRATPRYTRVMIQGMGGGASGITICDPASGLPITDNETTTAMLHVPLDGVIVDVDLGLNVSHTCIADLEIVLTAPDGTSALVLESFVNDGLFDGLGCPANFTDTVIDDEAPTNLADGIAPFTGSFNAIHPTADLLSALDGASAGGVWTLDITDEALGDSGTLNSWCVILTLDSFVHASKCAVDGSQPLDDFTTATSTIDFPFAGTVIDADVTFDVSHTCIADLQMVLTAPDGTSATFLESFIDDGLFDGLGCPVNFTGTTIDDEAPINLADGAAPFTGTFNAIHPTAELLSVLDGTSAQGTWSLAISDEAGGDSGSFDGWCLSVTLATGAACPWDVDGDGLVGFTDLTAILANWGACP